MAVLPRLSAASIFCRAADLLCRHSVCMRVCAAACRCSYLLNPVSVLSCASLSLVVFTTLPLTAALASGAQGTENNTSAQLLYQAEEEGGRGDVASIVVRPQIDLLTASLLSSVLRAALSVLRSGRPVSASVCLSLLTAVDVRTAAAAYTASVCELARSSLQCASQRRLSVHVLSVAVLLCGDVASAVLLAEQLRPSAAIRVCMQLCAVYCRPARHAQSAVRVRATSSLVSSSDDVPPSSCSLFVRGVLRVGRSVLLLLSSLVAGGLCCLRACTRSLCRT